MQTIDDSLLQISVDENGAQLTHLISKSKKFDYFAAGDTQGKMAISFPKEDANDNLALKLPWTVVDKGDTRMTLTLIDNAASYKNFPYHFEMMATYVTEGTQLNITFNLKNNSNKKMPFELALILPIYGETTTELNKIGIGDDDQKLALESTDFKFHINDKKLKCTTNQLELAGETEQNFELQFTLR